MFGAGNLGFFTDCSVGSGEEVLISDSFSVSVQIKEFYAPFSSTSK